MGVELSIAGSGNGSGGGGSGGGGSSGQKREATESRTELRVDVEAEIRQTSTGRPLRECREKVGFNYVLGKIVEMLKGRVIFLNLNSVGPNEYPALGRHTEV